LKKTHHKKGLLEWLKVYALTSNPRTEKKKKEKEKATPKQEQQQKILTV
jgi:ribosomal protein S21